MSTEEKGVIERTTELFAQAQQDNHYLYFELAYTHVTDWMCWLIDKGTKVERGQPWRSTEGFLVLGSGQADNAVDACLAVKATLEALLRKP